MPTPRVTIIKIRHTLQLLHSGNLSTRQIGAAQGISKFTVSDIASYTPAAGLDWSEAQHLSDEELQARLYRPPAALPVLSGALRQAGSHPKIQAEYTDNLLPLIYGRLKPNFAEAFAGFEAVALALLATLEKPSRNDSDAKA